MAGAGVQVHGTAFQKGVARVDIRQRELRGPQDIRPSAAWRESKTILDSSLPSMFSRTLYGATGQKNFTSGRRS